MSYLGVDVDELIQFVLSLVLLGVYEGEYD
jgi:hypothetical protein